jgi:serpin B
MVQMPKFELEWGGLLNDALEAMGMEKAFDYTQADFSRMTAAPDAHISRVNQKTYMRVDEEGTEAAAATSVVIGVTSAPPAVMVDRPYLLAIRERLSGAILFLGAVRDPR